MLCCCRVVWIKRRCRTPSARCAVELNTCGGQWRGEERHEQDMSVVQAWACGASVWVKTRAKKFGEGGRSNRNNLPTPTHPHAQTKAKAKQLKLKSILNKSHDPVKGPGGCDCLASSLCSSLSSLTHPTHPPLHHKPCMRTPPPPPPPRQTPSQPPRPRAHCHRRHACRRLYLLLSYASMCLSPYFLPAGPTVFPRRPVVLVCCPRTRTPQ